MFSENSCRKSWNIPPDRELRLRAKLNCGWSVHTANIFRKTDSITAHELKAIENVIQRANELEQLEVERVRRMVCRLKNMTRNALGDGKKTCSMCGTTFGMLRSSFVYCFDCSKAVCEKCRVDTVAVSLEVCMLCKNCSENREVWKKSGGWFYGRFPTTTEDTTEECCEVQESGSPSSVLAYDSWEHRAPDIVRLESFEPPEDNRNDNSLYKDWTMSSTPELNSLEDGTSFIELESFRKSYHGKDGSDINHLAVQKPKLSASCPSLTEIEETPKLKRKPSIRRKKIFTPARKIIKKISDKVNKF